MPLLGFTKLRGKLLDGSKTQTIRKPRKIPLKVGDKLYVYWMPRTKSCEKLGEAKITQIVRKRLSEITDEDAVKDGFASFDEFMNALFQMHPKSSSFDWFDVITFEWTKKETLARHELV